MGQILHLIAGRCWLSRPTLGPSAVPDGFFADHPRPAGTAGNVGRVYDGPQ
jgi:hypothetical protein